MPRVEELLHSEGQKQATDKIDHLLSSMKLTQREIVDVEEATRAQTRCPGWMVPCKYRLTASNFGKVLSADAIGRDRFPPSLCKTLIQGYDLFSSAFVSCGSTMWVLRKRPVKISRMFK